MFMLAGNTKIMAIVKNNHVVKGLSGQYGDMIFRQFRGKTFVTPKPSIMPAKQSEKQRDNRAKFKLATEFAKKMMSQTDSKAYYARKAKKLKLPNAYTAAITDYMRKPQISEVDASRYNGRLGDRIKITASKKNFKLASVNVIIASEDNRVLEQGPAQWHGGDQWEFRGEALLLSPGDSYVIMVTATDQVGAKTQELLVRSV
jgi:hypothetical protein